MLTALAFTGPFTQSGITRYVPSRAIRRNYSLSSSARLYHVTRPDHVSRHGLREGEGAGAGAQTHEDTQHCAERKRIPSPEGQEGKGEGAFNQACQERG